jgi:hypothetical protein
MLHFCDEDLGPLPCLVPGGHAQGCPFGRPEPDLADALAAASRGITARRDIPTRGHELQDDLDFIRETSCAHT